MPRRLLPVVLLALGIPAVDAQGVPQLDCGQPVDVQLSPASPQAYVPFSGTGGETVYIRLTANTGAGFSLTIPVLAGPFGNIVNARPRMQTVGPPVAGNTPIDLAGGAVQGETFIGQEFDLSADGTYSLRLAVSSQGAAANIHVVLTRINRPCSAKTTLTCGRSLAGAISTTVPGQVDTYQFSVQTGDVVSFRLLRVAASGSPNTNTSF